MTLLDWALLVVWLGVTLSGFWKGAVRLVFGGGGLVVGVWLAVTAGSDAAAALEPVVGISWIAVVLGRLLPLVACVLVGLVAGWGIERTLEALHLGWLNRLCGAGLAGAAGLLLLSLFLVTAMRLSPTFEEIAARSLLAPWLARMLGWVASQEAAADAAESRINLLELE
jgi:uncharacterized membrane protein required for colicin V production